MGTSHCGRFTLFVLNSLVLVASVVALGMGIYSLLRYPAPPPLQLATFASLVAAGGSGLLTSAMGFACTCLGGRTPFAIYRLLAGLAMLLSAVAAGLATYNYVKYQGPSEDFLLQVWNDMGALRNSFQSTFGCTGFEGCLPQLEAIARATSLGCMAAGWATFGLLVLAMVIAFAVPEEEEERNAVAPAGNVVVIQGKSSA